MGTTPFAFDLRAQHSLLKRAGRPPDAHVSKWSADQIAMPGIRIGSAVATRSWEAAKSRT